MRLEFKQGTPIHEQLRRIVKTQTGHKHGGRPGPGKSRKRVCQSKVVRARKFKAEVRKYWLGERECYPRKIVAK